MVIDRKLNIDGITRLNYSSRNTFNTFFGLSKFKI